MFEPTAEEYERWQRYSPRTRILRFGAILVTIPVVVYAWRMLEVNYGYVATSFEAVGDLLGRMYPPDYGYSGEIVGPMIETVNIALLGTGLSALLSVPIAYLAASNTTPNRLAYAIGRLIITVTRTVSTIIWAIIFVILFGPGAFAGVLAVAIRSIGFIGKLLSEAIEEIDYGQVRALESAGANGGQRLVVRRHHDPSLGHQYPVINCPRTGRRRWDRTRTYRAHGRLPVAVRLDNPDRHTAHRRSERVRLCESKKAGELNQNRDNRPVVTERRATLVVPVESYGHDARILRTPASRRVYQTQVRKGQKRFGSERDN